MEPIHTSDGRVTVPDEVIESMRRNKIGLKGKELKYSLVHILNF